MKFLASKGHSEGEVAEKLRHNEELKVDEESECTGPCGWRREAGPGVVVPPVCQLRLPSVQGP